MKQLLKRGVVVISLFVAACSSIPQTTPTDESVPSIEPTVKKTASKTSTKTEESAAEDRGDKFALNPELTEVTNTPYVGERVMQDLPSLATPLPHKELRAMRQVFGKAVGIDGNAAPTELSVWHTLQQRFIIPDYQHQVIDEYYSALQKHTSSVRRIEQRAKWYMPYIAEAVINADLPGEIALLPIVESNLKPNARSYVGAAGLWQFMPITGRRFGLKQTTWYDARFDITLSTASAITYLRYLNQQFNGDWLLALAAYNCGEARLRREIKKNRAAGKGTHLFDLTGLPRETRGYVPKLLAIKKLVEHDFALITDPNHDRFIGVQPSFRSIRIDKPTELAVIAETASLSLERLKKLNTAVLKDVTPPGMTVQLHLPTSVSKTVDARIVQLPQSVRVSWPNYTVKKGDTLSRIASQYSIATQMLREVNDINGSLIRIGQQLVIPSPSVAKTASGANSIASESRRRKNSRYTVRSGDSLWGIARIHNVTIKQLTKANSISAQQVLRPGQTLEIP